MNICKSALITNGAAFVDIVDRTMDVKVAFTCCNTKPLLGNMDTKNLVLIGITLLSTAAIAGSKANVSVSIVLPASGTASASGTLAGAQNSPDTNSYLRCSIKAEYSATYGVSRTLECEARDSNNVSGFCYLNSPPQAFVDLVQALKDTDTLTFTWDRTTQVCTSLQLGRSSFQIRTGSST